MPKGHIGNARTAGRRLGWPDWVRASAEDANISTEGSTADANVIANTLESNANATADIPQSFNVSIAQGIGGDSDAAADIPLLSTVHTATGDVAIANSDIPTTTVTHNATSGIANATAPLSQVRVRTDGIAGVAEATGSITNQRVIADAGDSSAETVVSIPVTATVHNTTSAEANAIGSKSIVTWQAGLGGVVNFNDGSGPAEGAEVHIIRDNDDTKVATTTTDSNGRWHVTVRGGKTTEADPPIYSIEVWHREGNKRDPNATLYNATNRPFIDTADPSETNPNDEFYYKQSDG